MEGAVSVTRSFAPPSPIKSLSFVSKEGLGEVESYEGGAGLKSGPAPRPRGAGDPEEEKRTGNRDNPTLALPLTRGGRGGVKSKGKRDKG
jgi:hypothetical protein